MTAWTTPADIRAKVQRRWDDGTILRALAAGSTFPAIEVPIRSPRPAELGDDLAAVRSWIAGLEQAAHAGARYTLTYTTVGGRFIGRNELPSRALVESFDQAGALLGVATKIRAYQAVLAAVQDEPDVRAWAADNPLRAVDLTDTWPDLLSAYRWLRDSRDSGRFLREITAPGVDTKFVERHRAVLAQLLKVPSSGPGFVGGLGLKGKPDLLRLRAHGELGLGLTDVTAPVPDVAALRLTITTATIVENEITFLSIPLRTGGVVLWGKGFEVDRAGSMPWLAEADVRYWGDLDTHGFAILNQLRAWLPQTTSVLMDRNTLLAHRERWGHEVTPTAANLTRLTPDESAVYRELVTDRYGDRIRLEQERIDWGWALERLECP
jgi:hypothetical protein